MYNIVLYNIGGGLLISDVSLSTLKHGKNVFMGKYNIKTFDKDLNSLIVSDKMFNSANFPNLKEFTSKLPNLKSSSSMFSGIDTLECFISEMNELLYAINSYADCDSLNTFVCDMSSLVYAYGMFNFCYNLNTFISSLDSLMTGLNMFSYCKLSPESVMHIVHSIKDITKEKELYTSGKKDYVTQGSGEWNGFSEPFGFMSDGRYVYTYSTTPYTTNTTFVGDDAVGAITIGIDVSQNNTSLLNSFARNAGFEYWSDLKKAFVDKGWKVSWRLATSNSSIYLSEDEQFRGVPVYARLLEADDASQAEYCTEDGTKYYNIDWGHDVTHPDEYLYFGSLLEACGYYGVIPKKYLEEK